MTSRKRSTSVSTAKKKAASPTRSASASRRRRTGSKTPKSRARTNTTTASATSPKSGRRSASASSRAKTRNATKTEATSSPTRARKPRVSRSPPRSLRLATEVARSISPPSSLSQRSRQARSVAADIPELMNIHTYRFPSPERHHHRQATSSGGGGGSANKVVILGQMLACVAGIYFCFSAWSLKQEQLMTKPYDGEMFPTVFGVSFAQSVAGFLVAFAIVSARPLVRRLNSLTRAPDDGGNSKHSTAAANETILDILAALSASDLRAMLIVGFTTAFGATLGYAAMRRLSFPVVLATKMSKMVPVMVVGFVLYGTRYSWRKVASCALITCGILSFYLMEDHTGKGKSHGSSSSSGASPDHAWLGFVLLFINLLLDGFSNSTQDVLVKRHHWSGTTLMLCTNLASALWSLAMLLLLESRTFAQMVRAVSPPALVSHFAFNDLSRTIAFLQQHPAARRDLLIMSLLNAVGQIFVYQTISLFDTLTLTAMTLVRKAGSVLLSIFVHGHSISKPQWASLAVVMLSVVFEAYVNITETSEKRKRQQQEESIRRRQDAKKD